MKHRPVSITWIGVLFSVTGVAGILRALWSTLDDGTRNASELYPMAISGALAAIGGWLALRGRDAGRWILVGWMAGHVVLSLMHSTLETIVHIAIFVPIVFLLFRRRARDWFRSESAVS
jgi:hypothetical protein